MAERNHDGTFAQGNQVAKAYKGTRKQRQDIQNQLNNLNWELVPDLYAMYIKPDVSIALKIKILLALMEYTYPKLKATEITQETNTDNALEMLEVLKSINDKLNQ